MLPLEFYMSAIKFVTLEQVRSCKRYNIKWLVDKAKVLDSSRRHAHLVHRIETEGPHESEHLNLCPYACDITHVHYAGSGPSSAFSDQEKR